MMSSAFGLFTRVSDLGHLVLPDDMHNVRSFYTHAQLLFSEGTQNLTICFPITKQIRNMVTVAVNLLNVL